MQTDPNAQALPRYKAKLKTHNPCKTKNKNNHRACGIPKTQTKARDSPRTGSPRIRTDPKAEKATRYKQTKTIRNELEITR